MKNDNISERLGPTPWAVNQCYSLLNKQATQVVDCAGLVIGCGNGDECVHLQRMLGCFMVGLDVIPKFSLLF